MNIPVSAVNILKEEKTKGKVIFLQFFAWSKTAKARPTPKDRECNRDIHTETAKSKCTATNLKKHNTYKALIAISPSGAISFVSDLFGGSISDKELTS